MKRFKPDLRNANNVYQFDKDILNTNDVYYGVTECAELNRTR